MSHRVGSARGPNPERGSATVEFALVVPMLFIVLLAVVQMESLLQDRLLVTDAAREAAREAAVSIDEGSVRAAAERSGLDPGDLDVEIVRAGGRGTPVRVRLTYLRTPSIPVVRWLFPASIALVGEATARQEFEP